MKRPLSRFQRTVVSRLAPRDERAEILGDLEEEAEQIAAAHGAGAARRFVRWQIAASAWYWLGRRGRAFVAAIPRGFTMLHPGLLTDARYALRRLRHARGYSALAIVTLAIGIGAVSTVFSLAYALWLKPLPYHEPHRLLWIHARHEPSRSTASLTPAEFAEYQGAGRTLSGVAGFSYGARIVRVEGEPARIVSYHVSPNLFRVLGVRPALGRDFVEADLEGRVVILSHAMWVTQFSGDPGAVGRTLSLSGAPYEVVGVMPRGFTFPRGLEANVWTPAQLTALGATQRIVQAVGRLAPGAAVADAAAEIETRARQLAQASPATNRDWSALVSPAGATTPQSSRLAFQAMLGIVSLFLLIACTNLAGLLLARNARRRGELAICLSIGASSWRLARELFIESALLAAAGAAGGLLLAAYGARALAAVLPVGTPGLDDIGVNPYVIGVAAVVAIAAATLVALLPALSLRTMQPSQALAGTRSIAAGTAPAQRGLVVVEVVLAFVLLVGAASMTRSFFDLLGRDRGYDPRGLQALNVSLPFGDQSYRDASTRARAFDSILERVSGVVGVRAAAAATGFPGSRLGILGGAAVRPDPARASMMAALHAATPNYFDVMRVPITAGRAFSATDAAGAPPVAIVNERLARQYPGANPIGQRVPISIFGEPPVTFEIVGVAGNISLTERVDARIFIPLAQQSAYWVDLVFRADGAAAMPAVRRALRELNPDLLIENESSLQGIISDSLALQRTQSAFAAVTGTLATVVAAVGLYALMTFIAAQRRREFGLRLALGSQPRQLFRDVLSRALRLVAAGVALGVLGTGLLIRLLGTQVFGLTSVSPGIYAAVTALVVGVSVAAVVIPARQVMRTDPLEALRAE